MFEILKEKITNFAKSIFKQEEKKVNLSFETQLKSIFSDEVVLTEKDISTALDEFEIDMLESDVTIEISEKIKEKIKEELVNRKIKKDKIEDFVINTFKKVLLEILEKRKGKSLDELIEKTERPFKIMFVGPNGSGKTSTIAKIANLLKNKGYNLVIAASDTFRAAAIEQLSLHAEKLGIKVIKGNYGSDPAAVAFEAIAFAKNNKIDVVIIDTAGRQEINANLINELKKIVRVTNPSLKIFIGETITGNSIINQIKGFHDAIKLDGIILTKLDCDAKGGSLISIAHTFEIPIMFITFGQNYEDIEEFNPEKIVNRIVVEK